MKGIAIAIMMLAVTQMDAAYLNKFGSGYEGERFMSGLGFALFVAFIVTMMVER